MKRHVSLLFVAVLMTALCAWAQSGTGSSTGSTDNSAQTGSSGSMASQAGSQASDTGAGQQTLEGCIIQDEQDYYLEPLSGQEVRLTGANVSQHVNHHVQVKGTQQSASSAGASSGTSGSMAGSSANAPAAFLVTEVDMVSESCPANLKHRHASTGSQPQNPQ